MAAFDRDNMDSIPARKATLLPVAAAKFRPELLAARDSAGDAVPTRQHLVSIS
jgi:hypothetical protein